MHFLPDVQVRFTKRLSTMTRLMTDFWNQCAHPEYASLQSEIIGDNARQIPLVTNSVDHIFTSPPYCNALDYTRAHAFSVAWLEEVLNISSTEYSQLGRDYIGTERAVTEADMWIVMGEMDRVLKKGRHLILVICPSHIRKVEVPTRRVFLQMAEKLVFSGDCGLETEACMERTIDNRRRLLPYMQEAFGQRMKTEYILIFKRTGD